MPKNFNLKVSINKLTTEAEVRFIGPGKKWQLVLLQGMLAALILLFCILILLLVYNTLDNVSPSGLDSNTLL